MSAQNLQAESEEYYMHEAWLLACEAAEHGEVPVGAVVVCRGQVIARAWNQVEMRKDATAHAEMLALSQAAAAIGDWRLNECCLYVTKEPCPMCAGAMVNARLGHLIFGCRDPRGGAVGGALDLAHFPGLLHQFDCQGGVCEEQCAEILREFFRKQRQIKTAESTER